MSDAFLRGEGESEGRDAGARTVDSSKQTNLRASSTPPGPAESPALAQTRSRGSAARDWRWVAIALLGSLLMTGVVEWQMGRSALGPDGRFGFWEGNIWTSECSQRVADPYSFSHIGHGLLFYAMLWMVLRRRPLQTRFLLALLLEVGWEILENSPIIINRYRQTTMALGYDGDSILNSCGDVLMMALGFWFAWWVRPRTSLLLLLAMEIGCVLWIRDNLTLNVIMLVHPVEKIKAWQVSDQPPPKP